MSLATHRSLTHYMLRYKWRWVLLLFVIVGTTLTSGISVSLVVPLVDRVLMADQKKESSSSEVATALSEKTFFQDNSFLQAKEKALRHKLDELLYHKTRQELLVWIALGLVLLLAFKGVFMFFKEYGTEYMGQRIVKDLRGDLYAHVQTLSLDYFQRHYAGDVMVKLTSDTGLVHQAVTRGWAMMIFEVLNAAMYAAIAFWLHWKLTFVALILLPLFVYPIVRLGYHIRKMSDKSQQRLGRMTTIIQETLSGIKVVKAFCAEVYEVGRFKEETRHFFRTSMKSIKRNAALSPMMEIAVGISMALFLIVGGREVLQGRLTAGQFALFIVAVMSLFQPLKRAGKAYGMVQQSLASADRVFAVFAEKPTVIDRPEALSLTHFTNSISFENVSVAYGEGEPVLKNISVSMRKGDVTALVGRSGAGKTSLVNLLPRFYDPAQGRVLIDGRDIRDYQISSLRSLIGVVSQDVTVFHESIAANIAYGAQDMDIDKVKNVARLANAYEFISALPQGFDTFVGDQGCRLSGGERQRIAIARALYKNPPILILDEATSALDTQTERLVQEAIERLMQGRTVLVIAHRLSTITRADHIVVLDQKQVVQVGRHEDLLRQQGLYQQLYQLQFKDHEAAS